MSFESNTGLNVLAHYGERDVNKKFGGITGHKGDVVQVEYIFDHTDFDITEGQDALRHTFPANSFFKDGWIEALEGAAGSSPTISIGLKQPDGTAIDVDGFVDGVDVTTATGDLSSKGNWVRFSDDPGTNGGALVDDGSNNPISNPANLVATLDSGSFTAGKFRILIEYIQPRS